MDKLRKLFKNKDKPINGNLAVMAAIGVILLIVSSTLFKNKEKTDEAGSNTYEPFLEAVEKENGQPYENQLEKRLEALFMQVEGVGKVSVMITMSQSEEIVVAEDVSTQESSTIETDAQGGTREVSNKSIDSQKIIIQSPGGGQQPLILKEIEPKIEGVIIVAEGGDDVLIKEALMKSATTVLGIESHKVEILKMK